MSVQQRDACPAQRIVQALSSRLLDYAFDSVTSVKNQTASIELFGQGDRSRGNAIVVGFEMGPQWDKGVGAKEDVTEAQEYPLGIRGFEYRSQAQEQAVLLFLAADHVEKRFGTDRASARFDLLFDLKLEPGRRRDHDRSASSVSQLFDLAPQQRFVVCGEQCFGLDSRQRPHSHAGSTAEDDGKKLAGYLIGHEVGRFEIESRMALREAYQAKRHVSAKGTLLTLGHVVTLVALVSVVWVPARLLLIRGVPTKAKLLLFAALTTYLGMAISITLAFPELNPLLLGLVVSGWVVALWRAQPTFGARRGRPLGSLGLSSSFKALANYDFYLEQARRFGPIFKSNQYFRPVLCIVGLERCQTFLRVNRGRLTSAPLPINRHISGGLLRYMDTAQHRKYRRLLASCMTPRALLGAEKSIKRTLRNEISALATASHAGPASGVKPYAAIDKMVYGGLTQLFFAIEAGSRRANRLHALYREIDHRRLWRSRIRTREVIDSIVEIVRDRASELTAEDVALRGSFLAEAIHDDRQRVEDSIFVENLVYFLHIARCDLDGLCAWLLKMICDHPEWALKIRQSRCEEAGREDETASGGTLADRFVKETLRLRQSEYLYRTVAQSIEWNGFSIPAGWLVRLCIRESHVDAEIFDRPTDFDPDRFSGTTFSQQEYQPFGIYEHACMGAQVTATFSRVLVEELAERYSCSIVRDGTMEPGLHHHNHWRPSSRLRVRLEPVSSV